MAGEILRLAAIEERHERSAGAKAFNLALLLRAGFPVPPGFCVPAEAYAEHVAASPIGDRIEALSRALAAGGVQRERAAAHSFLSEIREAIEAAPLSPVIADEITRHYVELGGGEVAVRSSATAEDLPGRSFAGQYDTVLGVEGIRPCLGAVKRCWASLWSERAFHYRERNGIDGRNVRMAVIVQRMVAADAAGVIFTVDVVRGRSDRLMIEASAGLGEGVVSGRVRPDRYVLAKRRSRILERSVASAGRPCIDDATCRRLGRLAVRIERAFGGRPQDIEWAVAGGVAHIVQARPIIALGAAAPGVAGAGTAAPSPDARQIWTNANTGEILPDVPTPMTWSVVKPGVLTLFRVIFGSFGVSFGELPVLNVIAGRAYFNVNTLVGCLRRLPSFRSRDLTEMFGGHEPGHEEAQQILLSPEAIPRPDFSRIEFLLRLPSFLAAFLSLTTDRASGAIKAVRDEHEALRRIDPARLSDADLVRLARRLAGRLFDRHELLVTVGVGAIYSMAFLDTCEAWFGAEGREAAMRLLRGIGGLDDADAGHALWRLATIAREHPGVERIIAEASSFDEARPGCERARGGAEFLAAWDRFMEDHGHHARGEIELSNARWSESPDYILSMVRSYVKGLGAIDPVARARRLAAEREELARRLRSRLRNPLKRLAFDIVLRRSQDGLRLRENLKSEVVRRLALCRRALLELGGRLAARGVLRERDDIFFLTFGELGKALKRPSLVEVVAERRAEFARDHEITPPPIVIDRFDPDEYVPAQPLAANTEVLHGLAVCPGVATGAARVILRAETGTIEPGEILVIPFADPGWAPYFINAAGIVMDMGGLLSHGCIIAREYGIPTVANVGPATTVIETGRLLRVDGDRGVVTLL